MRTIAVLTLMCAGCTGLGGPDGGLLPDGGGRLADGGAPPGCQDACQPGQSQCLSGQLSSCALAANGCFAFASPTACPANTFCNGGQCGTSCVSNCIPGVTRCTGSQVETCMQGPQCSDWGAPVACPSAGVCQNGGCYTCGDCPPGYACNGSGACAGDGGDILLNVQTVPVSGQVMVDGAPGNAQVTFTELTHGYTFTFPAYSSGAFQGAVYPGNYRVSAAVSQVDQVEGAVAIPSISITAPNSGLVLNVQTVSVAGQVTLNGAAPTLASYCAQQPSAATAQVFLVETTWGYTLRYDALCGDSSFSVSGMAYPGTYTVQVVGLASNLPPVMYPAGTITLVTGTNTLPLDVHTVAADGRITLNGARPAVDPACVGNSAEVKLTELTHGYEFRYLTLCGDVDYAFAGPVYPGVYRISVTGAPSSVPLTLPDTYSFEALASVDLSTTQTNLIADVQTVAVGGSVSGGGAPAIPYCSTNVRFDELSTGASVVMVAPCNSSEFSGVLHPGTYRVSVEGYVVLPSVSLTTPTPDLQLDLPTSHVEGKITLNGAPPTLGTACATAPTAPSAAVSLVDRTQGVGVELTTTCSDSTFSFRGWVFPGTYEARASGAFGPTWSSLPFANFLAAPALDATQDLQGLVFDVQTRPVTGHVALNGGLPSVGAVCPSYPSRPTATVTFLEVTKGYSFTLQPTCNDFAFHFDGTVYPGTYQVSVQGSGPSYSNLPNPSAAVVVGLIQIP